MDPRCACQSTSWSWGHVVVRDILSGGVTASCSCSIVVFAEPSSVRRAMSEYYKKIIVVDSCLGLQLVSLFGIMKPILKFRCHFRTRSPTFVVYVLLFNRAVNLIIFWLRV